MYTDKDSNLINDHFPLKKISSESLLIEKVNDWGVQQRDYCIKFEFIKGIKNILADSLSRFIDHDVIEPSPPENNG